MKIAFIVLLLSLFAVLLWEHSPVLVPSRPLAPVSTASHPISVIIWDASCPRSAVRTLREAIDYAHAGDAPVFLSACGAAAKYRDVSLEALRGRAFGVYSTLQDALDGAPSNSICLLLSISVGLLPSWDVAVCKAIEQTHMPRIFSHHLRTVPEYALGQTDTPRIAEQGGDARLLFSQMNMMKRLIGDATPRSLDLDSAATPQQEVGYLKL